MNLKALLIVSVGVFFACKNESNTDLEPTNPILQNTPFRIGEYDTFDLHETFIPPLILEPNESIKFDFDKDGKVDYAFFYDLYTGMTLITSEFYSTGDEWKTAAQSLTDSIFFCSDSTVPPNTSNYYYNISAGNCNKNSNEFVRMQFVGDIPDVLSKGSDYTNLKDWKNITHLHNYRFEFYPNSGCLTIETPFYINYHNLHYLSLQRILNQDTQHAWIALLVDTKPKPWVISVHEFAVENK